VLIDTAGAMFGILLIQLIVYSVGAFRKRKRLKSSNLQGDGETAKVSDSILTEGEDRTDPLGAAPMEADIVTPDEETPHGDTAEGDPSDNREEEVAPCELPPTD
jgi:hypothetical protein